MVLPYGYDDLNIAAALNPSAIHASDTGLAAFFRRILFERVLSVFKFNLPENWSESYFLRVLFGHGFIAVVNTDKYGVICQECAPSGYNIYREPTRVIISNPLINGDLEPVIGVHAALIRLRPNYESVLSLVSYYAEKLAIYSQAADINVFNSRLAYVFAAGDTASAKTFEKLYDTIAAGKPAVAVGKNLFSEDGRQLWNTFGNNLKQNYIAGDMLADMRSVMNEFDSIIGIPNANTDKRERMITDEVNANNIETRTLGELWLDTLSEGIEQANRMFDLNISVDWRFDHDSQNDNTGVNGISAGLA